MVNLSKSVFLVFLCNIAKACGVSFLLRGIGGQSACFLNDCVIKIAKIKIWIYNFNAV